MDGGQIVFKKSVRLLSSRYLVHIDRTWNRNIEIVQMIIGRVGRELLVLTRRWLSFVEARLSARSLFRLSLHALHPTDF